MKNRKFRIVFKYCICYLLIILFFAIVYFFLFKYNTTNFYISEEFNEKCDGWFIDRSSDALKEIHDRKTTPFSIDDFNQTIKPLNDKILQIYNDIDSLQNQRCSLDNKSAFYHKDLEVSRRNEIEQFRQKSLLAISDSISNLEINIRDSLQKGVPEERMIINGTYVHLANLKLLYACENVKVSSYIIEHYGSFGDRNVLDSLVLLNQKVSDISREISALEDCKRLSFNIYEDSLRSFHRHRLENVRFTDFIYFSLLIATSNSFGDILPNSTASRIIVFIQLIIGILCVAYFLNKLF